jgi:hypothetical protein
VFRTNHSAFQYRVVDTAGTTLAYNDTPLQNCWIEEILVRNVRSLNSILPPEFGFTVKAEVFISCDSADDRDW